MSMRLSFVEGVDVCMRLNDRESKKERNYLVHDLVRLLCLVGLAGSLTSGSVNLFCDGCLLRLSAGVGDLGGVLLGYLDCGFCSAICYLYLPGVLGCFL